MLRRHKVLHDLATIRCSFELRTRMASSGYTQCSPWATLGLAPGFKISEVAHKTREQYSPKVLARLYEIRKNYFLCFNRCCHLLWILALLDNKFKAPKTVLGLAKTSANGRARRVTDEIKLPWEKEIIRIFR